MRYRKGDTTVDAVLFVPAMRPWPEGVVSWDQMPYRPRDMSWGYIDTVEGRAHIQNGDWVVTDEAGKHLVSDAVFKVEYVRVSEPTEKASEGQPMSAIEYALGKMVEYTADRDYEAGHDHADSLMCDLVLVLAVSRPAVEDADRIKRIVEMYRQAKADRWKYA